MELRSAKASGVRPVAL